MYCIMGCSHFNQTFDWNRNLWEIVYQVPTTEIMSPEEIKKAYGRVTSMIGGGFWQVKPGESTDDTAMTLAVA